MRIMFSGAKSFNQNISGWDVSSVTDMWQMFNGFQMTFNQDLSLWDVSSVIECTAFAKVSGNSYDIESWTLPKPNFTNCIPGQKQTD